MIMCWVLFGIAFTITAICAAFYIPAQNEVKSTIASNPGETHYEVNEHLESQIEKAERIVAAMTELERRKREGLIENPDDFSDTSPEAIDKATMRVALAKLELQQYTDARQRRAAPLDIGGPAGIAAIVLLIWNIIWHTGRWIWMGRESGVEAKP